MEARRWREIAIEPPEDALEAPLPVPEGIRAWKNAKNKYCVLAIHYTADASKRSNDWYSDACANLREDQILRELEIDFSSKAGTKAFPYLSGNENYFRLDPPHPIPSNWKIIAGLDYGATNPTAVHWYAIDPHRRFWCFDEFYMGMNQVKGGLPEFANYLKKHPYYPRLRMIAADPKIFSRDQNILTKETGLKAFGTIKSVAELLMGEGIHKLQRANNDRVVGLGRVQQMFNYRGEGITHPYLFIGSKCDKLWWELNNLVYKPDDNPNKNREDDVIKRSDHGYDALRYALLSEDIPAEVMIEQSKAFHCLKVLEDEIDERINSEENGEVFSVNMGELDGAYEFGEYH